MKRAIYIYNPMSGGQAIPQKLDRIFEQFQNGGVMLQPYRFFNDEPGKLLSEIQRGEYDFVVTSGGDGTINAAVNLILKNNLDLPLGIIPSGTCNYLAGSLNLPSSVNECIDVILADTPTEIDVGQINGEDYFLSTCAGGCFVDVSFNTNSELKKNFGPFAYYLKAMTEMASVKSFKLKIKTETKTFDEEAMLFLILNGKHGAGFPNLIHEADLSDGIMDIVVVKNCLHLDMAAIFFKVLQNRTLKDRNVTMLRAKSCTVESNIPIPLSVDGERGPNLPIEVKFFHKALKIFVSEKGQ